MIQVSRRRGRARVFTQPYQEVVRWRLVHGTLCCLVLQCGHAALRCGERLPSGSVRLKIPGVKCRVCAVEATRAAFGRVDYRSGPRGIVVPAHADTEDPTWRSYYRDAESSGRCRRG